METSTFFCALTDPAVNVAIKRTTNKAASVFLFYQMLVFPSVFIPTFVRFDTIFEFQLTSYQHSTLLKISLLINHSELFIEEFHIRYIMFSSG